MFWTAVKLCASARTAAASGLHEALDLAMLTCTQEKRDLLHRWLTGEPESCTRVQGHSSRDSLVWTLIIAAPPPWGVSLRIRGRDLFCARIGKHGTNSGFAQNLDPRHLVQKGPQEGCFV